ncbi:MAG TPA: hypothetical protein VMU83_05740 [Hanamia sp.]|nr:hypothetical protein [Hanamia sp.]
MKNDRSFSVSFTNVHWRLWWSDAVKSFMQKRYEQKPGNPE